MNESSRAAYVCRVIESCTHGRQLKAITQWCDRQWNRIQSAYLKGAIQGTFDKKVEWWNKKYAKENAMGRYLLSDTELVWMRESLTSIRNRVTTIGRMSTDVRTETLCLELSDSINKELKELKEIKERTERIG